MPVSKASAAIMQSQADRLGKEVPTRTFPMSARDKIVGALEAIQFVSLPKNDETIWGDYRSPNTLLVLTRTIEPVKNHQILQKVTFYEKDGLKVSANGDLNTLLAEAGI